MAAFTIPTSYVDQFSAAIHMLSEQQMSRLMPTVTQESVTGESFAIERLGGISINQVTDIGGDTPLDPHPHSRRWGFIKTFDVADRIDKFSDARLLINPRSNYQIRHAAAMGRGMDDEIIAALNGGAREGKNGETTVQLPAGQKVASSVGAVTGLNFEKLIAAKEILDANEVDEMLGRFFVTDSRGLAQLLADEKLTSADFNSVRALVRGEIDQYMGFTFVRSERLPTNGAGTERLNYAYAQPAIRMGVAQSPNSVAAERPDKRHSWQIYSWGSWGAVRVEDEMVVEVSAAITSA